MKVIIAGSRSIDKLSLVEEAITASDFPITEIVSGTACGADSFGELYAYNQGIDVIRFPANWKDISVSGANIRQNRYGKYNANAGHMRNSAMAKYADALIAVWNGESRGTKDMIVKMKKLGKPYYIHNLKRLSEQSLEDGFREVKKLKGISKRL